MRARVAGETGFLTIKGKTTGISRVEFEYKIPADEAAEIINTMCEGRFVEKTRYKIEFEGMVWEVDIFHGRNEGLVTAEIELESEDQEYAVPDWVGDDVSDQSSYSSSSLSRYPYTEWETTPS